MRSFLIVLQQTYSQAIRTRSFAWITILLVLLGAFMLAIPSLMDKFATEEKVGDYVLVSTIADLQIKKEDLNTVQQENNLRLGKIENIEKYKEEVSNKELDGLLILRNGEKSSIIKLDYYMKQEEPLVIQKIKVLTENVYHQNVISENNLNTEIANLLTVQIEPSMQSLDDTNSNTFLIVYLLIGFMYLSITTYGNSVATAIATEKSSRVMEVMITKISPIPMMFGKIIGIGLASLTQVFALFTSIILFSKLDVFKIPEGSIAQTLIETLTPAYTIYFLICFILGYFIYATLFAITGSMVSRPEELSSSTIPITVILMLGLLVEMLYVIDSADSRIAYITSYIPFTAPISLIVRITSGIASPLEILISLGIMLISIVLFALLAAKIYPKGILRNDQKLTFKQLLKSN